MEMAVRKWEKAANEVKMNGSVEKKVNRNTTKNRWAYTTFSNIKFHIVVVQNNVKEMQKKSVLWICKVVVVAFFFANREEKSLRHVAIVDQTTNQKRHLTK